MVLGVVRVGRGPAGAVLARASMGGGAAPARRRPSQPVPFLFPSAQLDEAYVSTEAYVKITILGYPSEKAEGEEGGGEGGRGCLMVAGGHAPTRDSRPC